MARSHPGTGDAAPCRARVCSVPVNAIDPTSQGFARALIVGAHPDDAEFYAGGTALQLARGGCEVHVVVCTDGRRGSLVERSDLSAVRGTEQAAAARVLGLASLVNLGRPDGELVADDALVAELVRAIRRTRPDVVLTHDPDTRYRRMAGRTFPGHSDHRAAGAAALDAIYPRAISASFFPEQLEEPGLQLAMPRHFWLFDTPHPDTLVWIDRELEPKLDALRCHESQAPAAGGLIRAAEREARHLGGGERPAEAFAAHAFGWG